MSDNQKKDTPFDQILKQAKQLIKQKKEIKIRHKRALKLNKVWKLNFDITKEKRKGIRTAIDKNLAVIDSLQKLQDARDRELKEIVQNRLQLQEQLAEQSDNCVKLINDGVGNIKNLGNEVAEYEISQRMEPIKKGILQLEEKLAKEVYIDILVDKKIEHLEDTTQRLKRKLYKYMGLI